MGNGGGVFLITGKGCGNDAWEEKLLRRDLVMVILKVENWCFALPTCVVFLKPMLCTIDTSHVAHPN